MAERGYSMRFGAWWQRPMLFLMVLDERLRDHARASRHASENH
jgi:hypothetical protein